jgi:hypothetical protein
MECLLVVAILGLICLLPVQFWRAIVAYDMQMAAEYHDGIAAQLAIMADHPAVWMDEFLTIFARSAPGRRSKPSESPEARSARCGLGIERHQVIWLRSIDLSFG